MIDRFPESAIDIAVTALEGMPEDVRLNAAIGLLLQAKEKIEEYRALPQQVGRRGDIASGRPAEVPARMP